MAFKAERVKSGKDYHPRNCICCVKGDPMPAVPGEKKWERYVLPGTIILALGIGVAASLYYHNNQQDSQRVQTKDISQKVNSP